MAITDQKSAQEAFQEKVEGKTAEETFQEKADKKKKSEAEPDEEVTYTDIATNVKGEQTGKIEGIRTSSDITSVSSSSGSPSEKSKNEPSKKVSKSGENFAEKAKTSVQEQRERFEEINKKQRKKFAEKHNLNIKTERQQAIVQRMLSQKSLEKGGITQKEAQKAMYGHQKIQEIQQKERTQTALSKVESEKKKVQEKVSKFKELSEGEGRFTTASGKRISKGEAVKRLQEKYSKLRKRESELRSRTKKEKKQIGILETLQKNIETGPGKTREFKQKEREKNIKESSMLKNLVVGSAEATKGYGEALMASGKATKGVKSSREAKELASDLFAGTRRYEKGVKRALPLQRFGFAGEVTEEMVAGEAPFIGSDFQVGFLGGPVVSAGVTAQVVEEGPKKTAEELYQATKKGAIIQGKGLMKPKQGLSEVIGEGIGFLVGSGAVVTTVRPSVSTTTTSETTTIIPKGMGTPTQQVKSALSSARGEAEATSLSETAFEKPYGADYNVESVKDVSQVKNIETGRIIKGGTKEYVPEESAKARQGKRGKVTPSEQPLTRQEVEVLEEKGRGKYEYDVSLEGEPENVRATEAKGPEVAPGLKKVVKKSEWKPKSRKGEARLASPDTEQFSEVAEKTRSKIESIKGRGGGKTQTPSYRITNEGVQSIESDTGTTSTTTSRGQLSQIAGIQSISRMNKRTLPRQQPSEINLPKTESGVKANQGLSQFQAQNIESVQALQFQQMKQLQQERFNNIPQSLDMNNIAPETEETTVNRNIRTRPTPNLPESGRGLRPFTRGKKRKKISTRREEEVPRIDILSGGISQLRKGKATTPTGPKARREYKSSRQKFAGFQPVELRKNKNKEVKLI